MDRTRTTTAGRARGRSRRSRPRAGRAASGSRRRASRPNPAQRARPRSPRATAARRAPWRCRRRARRTGCAPLACACDRRHACATSQSPRDTSCRSSPRPCPRRARQPPARRPRTAPSAWRARYPRVRPWRGSRPRRRAVRGHRRGLDCHPRRRDEEGAPAAPRGAKASAPSDRANNLPRAACESPLGVFELESHGAAHPPRR